jgi:hypothetical protein
MKTRDLDCKILVLFVVVAMLGVGNLPHVSHGFSGDNVSESPWSCDQCRIAENSIGDLGNLPLDFAPSISFESFIPFTTTDGPVPRDPDHGSPRAPPTFI